MATIIEQIRAEVERRKGYISVTHFVEELLSLIDSLQQEQTLTDCNELQEPEVDLEEEADRMFFSLGWYEGDHHQPMLDCVSLGQFRGIARHFYDLKNNLPQEPSCETCTNDKGCVTCKDGELWEGKEQTSEDLRKEFNKWLRGVEKSYGGDLPHYGEYGLFCVARHFANWQKAKMLKDAVEGYVTFNRDAQEEGLPCVTVIANEKPLEFYESRGFKLGDKVKIVIVPIKED